MTEPTGNAVEVRGLQVRRGSTEVFTGLDLDIPRGQITGLMGPSGCGKTTLMRSIVGVQKVEGGTVTVLGDPAGTHVAAPPRRLRHAGGLGVRRPDDPAEPPLLRADHRRARSRTSTGSSSRWASATRRGRPSTR